MTIAQQGLLTLLKSAITGEQLSLPEGFSLEEADDVIRKQSLLPLAYEGAYNCGIAPETELMQNYQKQYFQSLLFSEKQLRIVKRVCQKLEENEIDYMLLKGCSLKRIYPKPELRGMGDADILIRMEQYDKIKPIVQGLGFKEKNESQHELVWERPDLYLEFHKCLFAPQAKDFYAYFGDGWKIAVKQDGCQYAMRPEDEFVYIFTHMTKHYRGSGVGSRHILDLYVHRRAYPGMDEAYIENAMTQMHLLDFYHNIRKLLAVWFDGEACDEKTEFISQYILHGGSWGDLETRFYTEEARSNGASGEIRHARGNAIFRAIFPPLEKMQQEYNILFKCPWLYPAMWVHRGVKGIVCRPKQIFSKMAMLQKMTNEKVLARQRDLSYVGLDLRYYSGDEASAESPDNGADGASHS